MTRENAKYARLAAAIATLVVAVFTAGGALRGTRPVMPAASLLASEPGALAHEADTFRMDAKGQALKQAAAEGTGRTLEKFDSRRAYPGAPPIIPHPLFEDRTMGGKSCLGCHRDGGFVPPMKAYAPVTPHPDMLNCRQCHVPQKDERPFAAGSAWEKISGPVVNQEAMPAGPPPIPHALDMRTNCVACHGGPGAVAEIRSPHPERSNCRQCHVPQSHGVFRRGGTQ